MERNNFHESVKKTGFSFKASRLASWDQNSKDFHNYKKERTLSKQNSEDNSTEKNDTSPTPTNPAELTKQLQIQI